MADRDDSPVSLAVHAPWDQHMSLPGSVTCRALVDSSHMALAVGMLRSTSPYTVQSAEKRFKRGWGPPRAHPLALALHARTSRISVRHGWVLCHDGAELQRHTAAVMHEDRACDVAWCGKSEDVCPLGIGADDDGASCCVVVNRRDLLQRVVCPSREKAA